MNLTLSTCVYMNCTLHNHLTFILKKNSKTYFAGHNLPCRIAHSGTTAAINCFLYAKIKRDFAQTPGIEFCRVYA